MYKYLDFYLEELFRLSQLAETDRFSKYKLQEIVLSHQHFCKNMICKCHSININQTRKTISTDDVLQLIENIFQWSIQQDVLRKDKDQIEHISLKYISFVAKYLNNSASAYYKLKKLVQQEKDKSFYFESISDILCKNIELMLEERIQREALISIDQAGNTMRDALQNFSKQDNASDIFIPIFVKFIEQKIKFWNRVKDKSLTLSSLSKHVSCLSEQCQSSISTFTRYFHNQDISHWSSNIINLKVIIYFILNHTQEDNMLKYSISFQNIIFPYRIFLLENELKLRFQNKQIVSIFKGIVQNQIGMSKLYEQSAHDLLKKDAENNEEVMTNSNLMKGNILFIMISISKNRGSIINKNKERILSFFGYDENEGHCANEIGQLMPYLFSHIHNELIYNFVRKGYSHLFNGNHYTFAQSKAGFIIPVKIQIDYLNNFNDDFVLNGCIIKYQSPNSYFLLDENGIIEGVTQDIFDTLFYDSINSHDKIQVVNIITYFIFQVITLILYYQIQQLQVDQFQVIHKLNILFIIPQLVNIFTKRTMHSELEISSNINGSQQVSNQNADFVVQNEKVMIKVPKALKPLSQKFSEFTKKQEYHEKSLQHLPQSSIIDGTISSIPEQFQQFFSKNKSVRQVFFSLKYIYQQNIKKQQKQWEYFNSKHFSVTYNLQSRHLNTMQDKKNAYNVHKQYYVLSVTNIEACNRSAQDIILDDMNTKTTIQTLNNLSHHELPEKPHSILVSHQQSNQSPQQINFNPTNKMDKQVNKKTDLYNFPSLTLEVIDEEKNGQEKKVKNYNAQSKRSQKISFEIAYEKNDNINKQEGMNSQKIESKLNQNDNFQDNSQEDKSLEIMNEDPQTNLNLFQQQVENNKQYYAKIDDQALNHLIFPQSPYIMSNHNLINSPLISQSATNQFFLDSDRIKDSDRFKDQFFTSANHNEEIGEAKTFLEMVPINNDAQSANHIQEEGILSNLSVNKLDETQDNKFKNKKAMLQSTKNIISKNIGFLTECKKTIKHNFEDGERSIHRQSTDQENTNQNIQIQKGHLNMHEMSHNNNIQNNRQDSLSSYKSSFKVFDSDVIQGIVSQRRPRILQSLLILINSRFILFILIIFLISLITILQIYNIENQLNDSNYIGKIFQLYSEMTLSTLKIDEIDLNILGQAIATDYEDQLRAKIQIRCHDYQTSYQNSFDLLHSLALQLEDPTVQTIMYSFNQQIQVRISIFEFFFKILNAVLSLGDRSDELFQNYLYFINGNFYEYSEQMYTFNGIITNDLEQNSQELKQQYLIFGGIVLTFLLILLSFSLYNFQKINNYQEKILLLICRLSVNDIDKEINMLTCCMHQLQSHQNRWQQINFSDLIIHREIQLLTIAHQPEKSINKKIKSHSQLQRVNQVNQQQLNGDNSSKRENQQTKPTLSSDRNLKVRLHKAFDNSQRKQQSNISSLLQGQKIVVWPFFLTFVFIILMSGIFFIIVLFLAYSSTQDLDPSLNLMKLTSNFYNTINLSIVFSEQLVVSPFMSTSDKYFPTQLNNTRITYFQEQISNIHTFMDQFLEKVDSLSKNQQVFYDLYSNDICQFFESEPLCQEEGYTINQQMVDSNLRGILSHGIASILTNYLQLFNNAISIIEINDINSKKTAIQDYLNTSLNAILILESYNLPMQGISLLLQKTVEQCQSTINDLKQITIVYYLIFGSVLIIIQFLADSRIKRNINQKIKKLNLALSFIPIPIAQEEITTQILKSIYRN